jgi:hypothetical protein
MSRSLPSEKGTTEKVFKTLHKKAMARIWPGLSCMCQIRQAAV